jgi:DNA-directed RNA polymerase subunit beta'
MKNTAQQMFESMAIRLASPEQIKAWSFGEILRPETINYRTGRSERGGLFDERVFGAEKDFQCYCGKYRGIRYKGIVCEKCGVELTRSVVRRERMGHIELAEPVAHIWFSRGLPSRMALILDLPLAELEKVIYFAGYIVISTHESEREKIVRDLDREFKNRISQMTNEDEKQKMQDKYIATKQEIASLVQNRVLSESEFYTFSLKYSTLFEAGIGAGALYKIFEKIDLKALIEKLEVQVEKASALLREKIQKRLSLLRQLVRSGIKPEWMFLKVIPVIPPALRPMVALEGGRYATSDINDLYRRVINRNNRLKKLLEIGAPDVILRNEKRILQEAVDALLDNSMKKGSGGAMSVGQARQLKSLADNLKGKQGLLRQNLLGKRVDYSGRSVIVVGPTLALDECGLPKYMALELFRPFVIGQLMQRELAFNVRGANRMIEDGEHVVWEILDQVIEGKYVLLNRAPTLHRLSIQAFKPVLVEGKAVQIHPFVCTAFNADFDGDQMAVHVPLSREAQREARDLIAAPNNLLRPQTGAPIMSPGHDVVLGVYWMTTEKTDAIGTGNTYASIETMLHAREFGHLDYRTLIKMPIPTTGKFAHIDTSTGYLETTLGRLLFNEVLPDDYPYINHIIPKKNLEILVQDLIERYGFHISARVLDSIKDFGFKYSTYSGTTFGMDEVTVPDEKKEIIANSDKEIVEITSQFSEGLITAAERHKMTIDVWNRATKMVANALEAHLSEHPSIHDMIRSGARGSVSQLNQAAGMKGVIQNITGETLSFPIKSCYKEGFSPLEYFINATTARKGLADTALNTAKAGYLTRKLHDVAQDVVITEENCNTKKGIIVRHETVDGIERTLFDGTFSRVLQADVKDSSGATVFKRGTLVTRPVGREIQKLQPESVLVRSPLTCESHDGVCVQCYGLDLGRNTLAKVGEAVGTVAAQSIGEPGTQLTLRTTHSGGVAGSDITKGLPRVEELFERREPKALALIAKHEGEVTSIEDKDGVRVIQVTRDVPGRAVKGSSADSYTVPYRRTITVVLGQRVKAGDSLTDGSRSPSEVYAVAGQEIAMNYLISEVAQVYDMQSASVARKHLEIIVRQMFARCRVTNAGDTTLVPGQIYNFSEIEEENGRVREANGIEATMDRLLLGIAEAASRNPSWLSSASFQYTQRTLTDASARGAVDPLRGLKENIIAGNLIPAGTGVNTEYIDMSDITEFRLQNAPVVVEEE